jgi:hypothetical protein
MVKGNDHEPSKRDDTFPPLAERYYDLFLMEIDALGEYGRALVARRLQQLVDSSSGRRVFDEVWDLDRLRGGLRCRGIGLQKIPTLPVPSVKGSHG